MQARDDLFADLRIGQALHCPRCERSLCGVRRVVRSRAIAWSLPAERTLIRRNKSRTTGRLCGLSTTSCTSHSCAIINAAASF